MPVTTSSRGTGVTTGAEKMSASGGSAGSTDTDAVLFWIVDTADAASKCTGCSKLPCECVLQLSAPHAPVQHYTLADLKALLEADGVVGGVRTSVTFQFEFDDYCDAVYWAGVNVRSLVRGDRCGCVKALELTVPHIKGAVLAVSGTDWWCIGQHFKLSCSSTGSAAKA